MKILVYRIGQLGDALVAVPAVRAIRTLFPQARMDLLTDKKNDLNAVPVGKVFDGTGIFEKVIYYNFKGSYLKSALGLARNWMELKRTNYDVLVYLAPSKRTHFQTRRDVYYFKSFGIKKIWGLPSKGPSHLETRPLTRFQQESLFLLDQLRSDGLQVDFSHPRFDLGIRDDEYDSIQKKMGSSWPTAEIKIFATCPFTAMPSKKWAAIRYLDVYRRLYEKHGFMPLFFGSNADRTEAGELLHTIGFGYNFCGLTIRESAAVMQRCDFYLGNDTGTMHLAAAEGLRCVAVFSARSNPGVWEPIGSGHRVLRADVPCEGCELTHCSVHKMLCLELISVEAVYDACLEILK